MNTNGSLRLCAAGAFNAMIAVGAGAFGAHGLRATASPRDLEVFETASRYHLIHALALVLCGILAARGLGRAALAGWLLQAGIILFSGSLYLLVVTGTRWLGAITPLGGITLMVGWLALGYTCWRAR
jgi:uncharacterized membrane protein YgdD (TMEM256/DUF423 family)